MILNNEIQKTLENNLKLFIDQDSDFFKEKIQPAKKQLENALKYYKGSQTVSSKYRRWSNIMIREKTYGQLRKNASNATKLQVYEACNSLINILLSREQTIQYALYYVDGKGQVRRLGIDKFTRSNFVQSSKMLRLSLARVKKQEDEQDQTLSKHYRNFYDVIKKTYNGTIGKDRINEGHIAEAFERHLQNLHTEYPYEDKNDINITETWEYMRESLNQSGWWTGGDIGNIQVKSFFNDSTIRLSSINSLEEVGNFLLWICNNPQQLEKDNKEFIKYAINFFTQKNIDSTIDDLVTEECLKEIQKEKFAKQ